MIHFVQIGSKLAAEVCEPTSQSTNSSDIPKIVPTVILAHALFFLKLTKSMLPQF